MKLSEIIFGYENIGKDVSLDHIISEGFSREEAKVLGWLRARMDIGKYAGLAGGLLILASIRKGYMLPLPLVSHRIDSRLVIGTLGVSFLIGNYFFNHNRRAGNTPLGNLYSNNILMANKFDLIQNFEPFNRKFTNDEVEQMLFNGKLKTYGRKKYIYNPHVHGDNEEVFKARHELFNSGKHVITADIKRDIDQLNSAKVANHEEITLKPFKITEHLDKNGARESVQKFGVFTKRHVI
jgi:hypothetical protein